jgi:hypothetical protein
MAEVGDYIEFLTSASTCPQGGANVGDRGDVPVCYSLTVEMHSKNPCAPKLFLLDHPAVHTSLCLDGIFPSNLKSLIRKDGISIAIQRFLLIEHLIQLEGRGGWRKDVYWRDCKVDKPFYERLLPNGDLFQERGT